MSKQISIFLSFLGVIFFAKVNAQEYIGTLPTYINKQSNTNNVISPPTTLSLPFYDNFCYPGPYANPNLWKVNNVYVNNTFGKWLTGYGHATFDAYNNQGTPYDTINRYNTVSADTLMSHNIDLSSIPRNARITLYWELNYNGYGFPPKSSDSFHLFLKNSNGIWDKYTSSGYEPTLDLTQSYTFIYDSTYFHQNFAIMFLNTATIGINNSNWNLSHVFLDIDNGNFDKKLYDIYIHSVPSSLLSIYHSMPFSHLKEQPNKYLKNTIEWATKNTSDTNIQTQAYLNITEGNTVLKRDSIDYLSNSGSVTPILHNNIKINDLNTLNKETFKLNCTYSVKEEFGNFTNNNSISITQDFGNYFAYDDGTSELFYFNKMDNSYNIPAYTAVRFDTEIDDTLRGFSIFLPQTTPSGRNKEFGIRIYRDIEIEGGKNELLYEQLFIYPKYSDTFQQLVTYKLDQAIPIPKGKFYMAIVQPAGGYSDSLYIGLDVTNNAKQKRYFNVQDKWEPSLLPGVLAFRAIVGPDFNLGLKENNPQAFKYFLYPNPSHNSINIDADFPIDQVQISDINGRILINSYINNNKIDISHLALGCYFITPSYQNKNYPTLKFIKE